MRKQFCSSTTEVEKKQAATPVGEVLIVAAAPRRPACLQLSSWAAGGVPGQLGGNRGLLGTRWVSITGEVAGEQQDAGFSRRAAEERGRGGSVASLAC